MDENKAKLSHFVGIIRIVAILIVTLLVLILFVRWANSRREANEKAASNTNQTTQTKEPEPSSSSNKSSKSDSDKSTDVVVGTNTNTDTNSVPSGIDDSIKSSNSKNSTTRVPETGISTPIVSAFMLVTIVYLGAYNYQLKKLA